MEGYHGAGNITLERTESGDVRIRFYRVQGGELRLEKSVEWDKNTWASGVASVSINRENGETFDAALKFHNEGIFYV